ncbi:MAG: ribosome small subunit-dependent GTPase A [Bacteroidetes bacterium 4484_276]|nr:MAG: ribosome small subunit-dependent GTPase A [Bacteroidetes bacterium 4484_276]OYT13501.1 MAG: ribosome small subunit-dependent GTPase A [Bacteroidetes bacterium 4572_114]
MEGIVIKSTGSWFRVRSAAGEETECKLKGKFRIKGIKTTNPVAVGDHVVFKKQPNENVGLIREIRPRHNHIIRKSTKLSKQSHIIAANIDIAILVVALKDPLTPIGFIDRFLVTSEAYHIQAALVFNKIDIYGQKELKKLNELTSIYEFAGYPCLQVSALTGQYIALVTQLIKNKVSLFSGISGVGKSALINTIEPGLNVKTGDISKYHRTGKHTTTYPEMHPLSFGGFIIDTPGIREFGLVDFKKEDIAERFPEMRRYMHSCQFNNCTHIHEPKCAVKEAVENGDIPQSRYNSYLRIYNDDYLEKDEFS